MARRRAAQEALRPAVFGPVAAQRESPFNVGVIGVVVMLVALVPSAMVVPIFGDFGHPATLLCLLLMAFWVMTRLDHRFSQRARSRCDGLSGSAWPPPSAPMRPGYGAE